MRWWLRAAVLSLIAGADGKRAAPGPAPGAAHVGPLPGLIPRVVPAGTGQNEPRSVVGRVGQSTVLSCGLPGALENRPPLYVIEWVRFGFVLPIFIKFGLYSPRVDPEYVGKSRGGVGAVVGSPPWGCCCLWTPSRCSLRFRDVLG